jgi:threonine dehydratase
MKLESLQRTGSFKLRGAAARLCALALAREARGQGQGEVSAPGRVIAASAGNHGLGVAHAARHFGMAATVLVSALTPENKRAAIAALGADLEVVGDNYEQAEDEARRRAAADPDLTFVSPFDDDHVIAGNGGLLARELLAQLPDIEAVICPVGGGGLAGGLGVELVPRGIRLYGASPEANCAMKRSLEEGKAFTRYDGGPTLAEGLEGGVSERTFRMAQDYCPDIALVSELGIRKAIAYAYRTLGLTIEASAAVPLAALMEGTLPLPSRRVVLIITGGNIGPDLLDQLLTGAATLSVD